ncbi:MULTISPECIES: ABC transporter ATP-binding protein [Salipiger]|jgi:multiple sugar transport system ATP-binding protein|uniref:Carbohydrate ABC transporter ATP-binding protein, CUT1 family n=1 Tax=Salipiger profundus TaxID=1229727 RepID=A0A1U7DE14_9RHOB|nr:MULTISPECIES: sn-glycerol-3-phosphate ABC transporter ATP-binding protein UgpC [Salipiger]APX26285.1 carbohydrate ABC transporter ATP-binding protein, CUT1 family [Salipiger profundus]GGA21329.1 sugar ABC transporter ATP-binding protein [Salipiger profundus]SFD75158.1 multiple sugar transport system ATP-binding protein [Salipiger profundus]
MSDLKLRDVRKSFGAVDVIKGVDFDVDDREFVVFVGPSGCGKSTLLRMIAGLESITSGELTIDGVRENESEPTERGLAMVFQSYALYPHMTVEENMGFALRVAKLPKHEIAEKVRTAAEVLELGHLLDRRPKELSGGQRQRVAIGRAIVRNPKIFLFDEPLSNLDAALRVNMRLELMRLHKQLDATMIYVTHDQTEAMTMADKIVVLRDGLIEQVGAPMALYNRPANVFVAGFIGAPKMNFLPARAEGGGLRLPGGAMLPMAEASACAQVGIRPEHLSLDPMPGEGARWKGTVRIVERLGGLTNLHVDVGSGFDLVVQAAGAHDAQTGDTVALAADPAHLHFFDHKEQRIEPELRQAEPA